MSEDVQLEDRVRIACDIAAGRTLASPGASGTRIVAAKKDLNAKGNGPWWYRMVWRNGSWEYFSTDRLPMGTSRAHERRAAVYGEVFPGELVCSHDKGSSIDDEVNLVCFPDADDKVLVECGAVTKRRDGQLDIVLPDGSKITVPNPRKK